MEEIKDLVLDQTLLKNCKENIAFRPLHDTGDVVGVPLLKSLGVEIIGVEEQMNHDLLFSTVKFPNSENFDSLKLAIDRAKTVDAKVVIDTDLDEDGKSIVVSNRSGNFEKFQKFDQSSFA
jgi:phosphomannomutase